MNQERFLHPPREFRARGLAVERGVRLLFSALDLTLNPGQLLQVAGPNGSGKTTLLRMLAGLSRPLEGTIFWDGQPLERLEEGPGTCLAYLGHQNALKDDLTTLENLTYAGRLDGSAGSPDQALVMLDRLGLGGYEEVPARYLSQGQKRRVALARLLLQKRPLWILDEPYAALDVHVIEVLRTTFQDHIDRGGMLIITTHQIVDIDGDCQTLELAPSQRSA
ncbi:cytochrome c biogenesis heme-transporting ATPase CcmA [Thioalkalivibrio sp. ALJT]|uniref:cytochrome c biogenesis heme-transporting ATPase CcmA n=1 Tax=Thioalkalivibrio sp. ALJT TaxID=1158146 RepID=UPI00037E69CA|nr:cytochrome c biogenesis heme-transporting ATPase CcmA [Thioalkalivibrio sp. ALJT]